MKKKFFMFMFFVIGIVAWTLVMSMAGINQQPIDASSFLLNTEVTITLYDYKTPKTAYEAIDLIEYYENMFSTYIPTSEIAQINNSNGQAVQVSDETAYLLEQAIYYGELSNGVFDVTVGSASTLWDFNSPEPTLPSASSIDEAVTHIDYNNIVVEGNTVTLLDPAAIIDLGGIAKGYIGDQVKQFLIDEGVTSAIVDLGGNIITVGNKHTGRKDETDFSVAITNPYDGRSFVGILYVDDKSVVTAGNYERQFEYEGQTYFHILDPETGYPVETDLDSVTIIADSSMEADALSTTAFMLGKEEGMALIESIDGVEGVFINEEGVYLTSGVEEQYNYTPIEELSK